MDLQWNRLGIGIQEHDCSRNTWRIDRKIPHKDFGIFLLHMLGHLGSQNGQHTQAYSMAVNQSTMASMSMTLNRYYLDIPRKDHMGMVRRDLKELQHLEMFLQIE